MVISEIKQNAAVSRAQLTFCASELGFHDWMSCGIFLQSICYRDDGAWSHGGGPGVNVCV